MKNYIRFILVGVFLINSILISTISRAENLIFYDDFPPFSYLENKQIKGLFVDLVNAVFDDMNMSNKLEYFPFKRALFMAKNGEGIVVGIYKTNERAEYLDFSDPLYHEKTVFFTPKNKAFPYQSISDLKGKTIAVKLGWSYGKEFDQAKQDGLFSTITGSPQKIYQMLDFGKIDAVVDNELSGLNVAKELGIKSNIEALPEALIRGQIYIAVKKGTQSKLIAEFNQHLKNIKNNGTYEKIIDQYN